MICIVNTHGEYWGDASDDEAETYCDEVVAAFEAAGWEVELSEHMRSTCNEYYVALPPTGYHDSYDEFEDNGDWFAHWCDGGPDAVEAWARKVAMSEGGQDDVGAE